MKIEQSNKETIKAFKQELRDLLIKYNAHIEFNVGESSDTYGLYGEKLVIYSQTPGSWHHQELVQVDGWTISPRDLK